MSAPQNFRSAFNGFHREDVVHYLEYINARHTTQVNQLTQENQDLKDQLLRQEQAVDPQLQQRCEDLEAQLEEALARCAQLEEQLEDQATAPAPVKVSAPASSVLEELETYRRAERIEREARERAELVYFQANSVLTEATGKVDGISADITDMADQVMSQLTQLQMAVSQSKQALQDAVAIMNAIRPNK